MRRPACKAWMWLACLALMLLAVDAVAQTHARLERPAIAMGESVLLEIDSDESAAPDLGPLQADFELGALRSSRQWRLQGFQLEARQHHSVLLRPRRPGMLQVPSLRVGSARTAPLSLQVRPAAAAAAPMDEPPPSEGPREAVFVETEIDDSAPYLQQAVAVSVRLNYAINLVTGELRQAEPEGGSLQPLGNDRRSVRVIDGRSYRVLERHYLLTPERSGTLVLPPARFAGEAESGFFDGLFGSGRSRIRVESAPRRLQVRPIPATAVEPWLPARDVRLQASNPPRQARAGEAFDLVIELHADGASAAQLPDIELTTEDGAQVFADAQQASDGFDAGRMQASAQRRFSIVPNEAGELRLDVRAIDWWQTGADSARRATLAPIRLTVLPGAAGPSNGDADGTRSPVTSTDHGAAARSGAARWRQARWLLAGIAIAVAFLALWALYRHRRRPAVEDTPREPTPRQLRHALRDALRKRDLAAAARLLPRMAAPPLASLDEVQARLADAEQRSALALLQAALWGGGDAGAAAEALQRAFARGPRWQRAADGDRPLLPPLYPQA
ncbi:BatD family protein [Luteimonas sp. e5]